MITPPPKSLSSVPMFPLPNYYLFPGIVAPLHIFEPRYRQLIGDLLDGPGRMVMATIKPGVSEDHPDPEVLPVGSLAEIVRHEELEDGRYLVVMVGLGRVTMIEIPSTRLYRQVDMQLIPDHDPDPDTTSNLKAFLLAALIDRTEGDLKEDLNATVGRLADLLLSILPLGSAQRAQGFLETDAQTRAELALAWDRRYQDLDNEAEGQG